ncbi:MAG: hypothetical protein ABH872_02205 [Candidatus Omnitrophota bacterium]
MSIIYESLKKAESKDSNIKPKESKKFNFTPIFMFLIILGVAGFIGKRYVRTGVILVKNLINGEDKKNKDKKKEVKEPLPAKEYTPNTYTLEGIIFDGDNPVAVINGKVLKEGESIDDMKVIYIGSATVDLLNKKGNTKVTLTL